TAVIKSVIERVGAKSPADMGKVMGTATKELAGKADGKEISAIVKTLLG
ncbi:MAG: GatB/YqeY domain-containing protein, partial [Bacteroidia bacterium]|nr:GatB/YqeY domain-containing protein [Bacteroidia bacterium]